MTPGSKAAIHRRLRLRKAVHGGFKAAWVEGGLAEDMVAAVGWLLERNPALTIHCTGVCVRWRLDFVLCVCGGGWILCCVFLTPS